MKRKAFTYSSWIFFGSHALLFVLVLGWIVFARFSRYHGYCPAVSEIDYAERCTLAEFLTNRPLEYFLIYVLSCFIFTPLIAMATLIVFVIYASKSEFA